MFLETNVEDNEQGNKELAAVLAEQGYEHRFLLGHSSHCGAHGNRIFPKAMRWLWREDPK